MKNPLSFSIIYTLLTSFGCCILSLMMVIRIFIIGTLGDSKSSMILFFTSVILSQIIIFILVMYIGIYTRSLKKIIYMTGISFSNSDQENQKEE